MIKEEIKKETAAVATVIARDDQYWSEIEGKESIQNPLPNAVAH